MFDCPTNLGLTDAWIAGVLELKCQGGIGRWTQNVFGLVDIRQGMRVGARRRKARGASGGGGSGIGGLACSGKRRQGKGAQLSRSLPPGGKHPNALNRV